MINVLDNEGLRALSINSARQVKLLNGTQKGFFDEKTKREDPEKTPQRKREQPKLYVHTFSSTPSTYSSRSKGYDPSN
jgi:hypothetical protein